MVTAYEIFHNSRQVSSLKAEDTASSTLTRGKLSREVHAIDLLSLLIFFPISQMSLLFLLSWGERPKLRILIYLPFGHTAVNYPCVFGTTFLTLFLLKKAKKMRWWVVKRKRLGYTRSLCKELRSAIDAAQY